MIKGPQDGRDASGSHHNPGEDSSKLAQYVTPGKQRDITDHVAATRAAQAAGLESAQRYLNKDPRNKLEITDNRKTCLHPADLHSSDGNFNPAQPPGSSTSKVESRTEIKTQQNANGSTTHTYAGEWKPDNQKATAGFTVEETRDKDGQLLHMHAEYRGKRMFHRVVDTDINFQDGSTDGKQIKNVKSIDTIYNSKSGNYESTMTTTDGRVYDATHDSSGKVSKLTEYQDNGPVHRKSGSPEFTEKMNKAFEELPPHIQKLLEKHGVTVESARKITDAMPEFKGVKPFKDRPGDYDSGVGALTSGDGKKIVIPEGRINVETGKWEPMGNREPSLRHEVGHALDHILETGKSFSQSQEFIDAYNRDIAKIPPEDARIIQGLIGDTPGKHSEAFAEVCAAMHGGSNAIAMPLIQRHFTETAELIRRRISEAEKQN